MVRSMPWPVERDLLRADSALALCCAVVWCWPWSLASGPTAGPPLCSVGARVSQRIHFTQA